jgi:hypothetical protein
VQRVFKIGSFIPTVRPTGRRVFICLKKPRDTVGELKSAAICVSYMPSLKAKTLGELAQEKVLLEL